MAPAMRQITDREACEMLDWFENEFGETANNNDLPDDNRQIAYAISLAYNGGLTQWFKDQTRHNSAAWIDAEDHHQSRADEKLYNWDIAQ